MSRPDPLDFFEKAAQKPKEKKAPKEEDDKLLDPGEEALAGLSVASSAAAIWGERIGNYLLGSRVMKGERHWQAHSPGEHQTMKGTLTHIRSKRSGLPPPTSKKLLGLFPISERPKMGDIDVLNDAVRQMQRMQPTVDSFIQKYDLPKKGVTMQFKGGPLSGWSGAHYNIGRRRIRLPHFSEPTVLHELGHAADFTGTRRGKFWGYARGPVQAAVAASLPIALIAGDEIKNALPGTIDDRAIEFMQQNAPAILGATLAATHLYPEGKATALALKHLKETKGPAAARAAAKKLIPAWGTYALMTIAPIVGMSLAKKYYNQAKAKEKDTPELEKGAGAIDSLVKSIREAAADIGHVGQQIGRGTKELVNDPHRMRRIGRAAKEVGTSPDFIEGALYTGIPATLATAYIYGSKHGPVVSEKLEKADPGHVEDLLRSGGRITEGMKKRVPEDWKQQHPGLYSGLVGAGAALSGGIITKLFADLMHAL